MLHPCIISRFWYIEAGFVDPHTYFGHDEGGKSDEIPIHTAL